MAEEEQLETRFQEDTQKDKYLTFRLAEENYGLDIGDVIEIIGLQKITQVPDMPSFIKGVINLRGQVIPVMDMRVRFHLPQRDYDERTCIVVTEVSGQTMGLVVDRVNEVIDIPETQVEPAGSQSIQAAGSYVKGLGKVGDNIRILLDTQKILAA
ncbi:MAG: chemotaxis protein CheW [Syntrophotaleaceae bacterium]